MSKPRGPRPVAAGSDSPAAAPPGKGWRVFFIAALVVGAVLRLSFGNDIEFKSDEAFMFARTRTVGVSEPLPTLGMESGVGVRNPPLSIWVFLALGRAGFATTPPELARAVELLNVAALAALFWYAWRAVPRPARESWLWAGALVCVNPFAVLLERKIWAQSTLPLFCILFLFAWNHRHRWAGAFGWGFVGVWLGQIHMSGFIFAGAVVIWTLVADVWRRGPRRVAWLPWLAGSFCGSLTMLTWLHYYSQLENGHSWLQFWQNWSGQPGRFWELWITGPLGLGLSYSLGHAGFVDYLKYPLVGGAPTWLMAVAHTVIEGLAGLALVRFLVRLRRPPGGWGNVLWGAPGSDDQLLLAAGFIGYGIFLTSSVPEIPRHYLMITFPLEWLWWVLIFQRAFTPDIMRRLLLGLWSCELALSLGYLGYIHVNQGAKSGDYGTAYQFQPARNFPAEFAAEQDDLGITLARQGKLDDAITRFRMAIRYDASNAVAHNSLGNVFSLRSQLPEAVAEYEEAVRLNPAYAGAHYNLGYALAQTGRRDEAVAQLREALRLNPGDPAAKQKLQELGVPISP